MNKLLLQNPSSGLLFYIKPHNATTTMAMRISGTGQTRRLIPSPYLHGRGITEIMTKTTTAVAVGANGAIIDILLPIHRVAKTAHASPPRLVGAPRAPGPARALGHGQVIPAEREEGADGAHEEAEEDVEAVVAKVEPARGGDEDGGEEGRRGEDEEVQGGRGGLAAGRGQRGVVGGEEPGRGGRVVVVRVEMPALFGKGVGGVVVVVDDADAAGVGEVVGPLVFWVAGGEG